MNQYILPTESFLKTPPTMDRFYNYLATISDENEQTYRRLSAGARDESAKILEAQKLIAKHYEENGSLLGLYNKPNADTGDGMAIYPIENNATLFSHSELEHYNFCHNKTSLKKAYLRETNVLREVLAEITGVKITNEIMEKIKPLPTKEYQEVIAQAKLYEDEEVDEALLFFRGREHVPLQRIENEQTP